MEIFGTDRLPDEMGGVQDESSSRVSSCHTLLAPRGARERVARMGCCVSRDERVGGEYASANASRREAAWKRTGVVGVRDANLRELPRACFAPDLAPTVRTLDASNNRIAALPPAVASLVGLQRLTLACNELRDVPPELGACVTLRALVLDRNRIERIPPAALGAWTKLQTPSLANNRLRELPPEIALCAALAKLDVSGNELGALPPELGECAKLAEIRAEDNRGGGAGAEASSDESLRGVGFVVPRELGRLSKLASLTLDRCDVRSIPGEIFAECASLVTLSLRGCANLNVRAMEETPGYDAFRRRVEGKHAKKIHGGAMIGAEGLVDGVDRDTRKERIVPHT